MMWWHELVGIPYVRGGRDATGADCWGIVRLAYELQRPEIELPLHGAVSADDMAAVARAIDGDRSTGPWVPVQGIEHELDVVVMMAVALGRAGDFHLGVVTRPAHVLHSDEGIGSAEMRFRQDGPHRPHALMMHRRCTIFRHKALT